VTRLCRLFGVTRPGFYAWRRRPESPRQREDRELLEEMRAIFERSGGTYGSPRLYRDLRGRGYPLSRRRVERLMREGGLRARVARVYRPKAGGRTGGSATHAGHPAGSDLGGRPDVSGGRIAVVVSGGGTGSVLTAGARVAARVDPGFPTHAKGPGGGAPSPGPLPRIDIPQRPRE